MGRSRDVIAAIRDGFNQTMKFVWGGETIVNQHIIVTVHIEHNLVDNQKWGRSECL